MEKLKDFKNEFCLKTALPKRLKTAFFCELKRSFCVDVLRIAFLSVADGKSVNAAFKAAACGKAELAAYFLKTYRAAINDGAAVGAAFLSILPSLNEAQVLRLKKRYFLCGGFFKSSAVNIINRITRRGGEKRAERHARNPWCVFDKEKFVR